MRTIIVSTRMDKASRRLVSKGRQRKAAIVFSATLVLGFIIALTTGVWAWLMILLFIGFIAAAILLYKTRAYFECYIDNAILHIEYQDQNSGYGRQSGFYRTTQSRMIIVHLEFSIKDICGYKSHSFLGADQPNLIQIEFKDGDFHCLSTTIPIEYLNKEQEALFLSFLDRLISRRQQLPGLR